MKERRSKKLTECFVGPYKVKGIISSNAIELELPKSIRIHYKGTVGGSTGSCSSTIREPT